MLPEDAFRNRGRLTLAIVFVMKTWLCLGILLPLIAGCADDNRDVVSHQELTQIGSAKDHALNNSNIPVLPPTRKSERLRLEIGVPQGWTVALIRQRSVADDKEKHRRVILQIESGEKSYPYRLAIANSLDGGPLNVEIESICSEGFTTYSERLFKQPPTEDDIDQFAIDYSF